MLVGVAVGAFSYTMAAIHVKSEWLRGLVDFIFPPLCLGCGEYTENDHSICDHCFETIDKFSRPFCLNCLDMIPESGCRACERNSIPLYAYGNYTAPLEQIIIQFKFKGMTSCARLFAALIKEQFGPEISSLGAEALVPVPLHFGRESYRGYNQAKLLATELSNLLEIDIREDLLSRVKKRRPQARLSLRERGSNIRGVFEATKELPEVGRVVLVDDVVTSGSTVLEASRELSRIGIDVVGVIAVAHAS